MKKYVLLCMVGLLSMRCSGQNTETETKKEKLVEQPKGSWKVDKEFDENGNLVRYDSVYSWSSSNTYDKLSLSERDSLMQSFKSKFFTNFSEFENQGFEAVFSPDSLFSKRFFNDDFFESPFGADFIDIDKIRQQMTARQKRLLEKYQSELIQPENEN
ncbi:MAG: hypothetical protein KBT69_08000 [Oceanihabitans sp.]|nr:hypothetical protein [Oceanihabitans sp.]